MPSAPGSREPSGVEPVELERTGDELVVAQGITHGREPVGPDDVVGVGQREAPATAGGDADVAGVVPTGELRSRDEPELRVGLGVGRHDGGGGIGGAVVDDEDLVRPVPRLVGERRELVRDQGRLVMRRNDDGELDVVMRVAGHENVLRNGSSVSGRPPATLW